jgi:Flp pilus assembly pilin Flp
VSPPSFLSWFVRLTREEDGQDLVEYGLLMAFFGLVALTVWVNITDAVGLRYGRTRSGVQGLWETPPPGAAPP